MTEFILADAEMKAVEEFSSTIPLNQGGTNHAENPLETNMVLQYGILIGVAIILVGVLVARKIGKKKK
ncbi:MAG: hypothetical protein ACI4HM_03600 [Ruminococcus sp.]